MISDRIIMPLVLIGGIFFASCDQGKTPDAKAVHNSSDLFVADQSIDGK